MSGVGKSLKGRGGGRGGTRGGGPGGTRGGSRGGSQAGGVNCSLGRSLAASNPTTSNLRDSVSPPVRHTHPQSSVPENSPPSETRPRQPTLSASSPTRDGSSSPTEQHPHQSQNQMTLDDLLAIPGRENYLPVLSLVPKEGTTW
ncbi:hypothetical protein Bca101_058329 [Brassica carinata]